MKKAKKIIGKILYYVVGIRMPMSFAHFSFGSRRFRQLCAKMILEDCGEWINIERGVRFGDDLKIGNGSGIGANSTIPCNVVIGDNVMTGQELLIFTRNHRTDRLDIPMGAQGDTESQTVRIGNDVWIGARVTILPGVQIGDGVVIGAGAVVTKNVPDFEVWAGNPARKVRSRLKNECGESVEH